MTNLMNDRNWSALTALTPAVLLGGALVLTLGITGCGEDEEPVTVERNTEPPPPPPPREPTVAELMAQLGIDDRIVLEETDAPRSTEERKAILTFFDAMVRGDDHVFGTMLPLTDRMELDTMVESGTWGEATDEIELVELETGHGPSGDSAVMAIITTGFEFQPQLWTYFNDSGEFVFQAEPTPPNVLDELYGDDRISKWFALIEEEIQLANRPDEVYELPQEDRSNNDDEEDSASGGGGSPASPGGGGRRRPERPVGTEPSPGPGGPSPGGGGR